MCGYVCMCQCVGWPVSPRICPSQPPSAGLQAFTGCWGFEFRSSCFHSKYSYLEPFPQPNYYFLKCCMLNPESCACQTNTVPCIALDGRKLFVTKDLELDPPAASTSQVRWGTGMSHPVQPFFSPLPRRLLTEKLNCKAERGGTLWQPVLLGMVAKSLRSLGAWGGGQIGRG